jgi:hypothetical protein
MSIPRAKMKAHRRAAFLWRIAAFPRGLATILRGAERRRRQSDGHDE